MPKWTLKEHHHESAVPMDEKHLTAMVVDSKILVVYVVGLSLI